VFQEPAELTDGDDHSMMRHLQREVPTHPSHHLGEGAACHSCGCYLPWNTGGSFLANAATPFLKSSVSPLAAIA